MAKPVAYAGEDQYVNPWDTVTLTGVGNDPDSGSSISAYTWTQLSGPTVTLSGSGDTRTFEAPALEAGATLVFGLVVTDNTATVSTQDTVQINVYIVTEFYAAPDTSWKPLRSTNL